LPGRRVPRTRDNIHSNESAPPAVLCRRSFRWRNSRRATCPRSGALGGIRRPPRGYSAAGEVEGGAATGTVRRPRRHQAPTPRQAPSAASGAHPAAIVGSSQNQKIQTKICVPSCRSKVDLGACRNSRRATCPDELCISASTPTSMTPKPSDHRHVRRGATACPPTPRVPS
jgi:hypothetical protein